MSKEQSVIIRGLVILLMLAYHLHDISDSYVSLIYIGGHPLTYYINNMAHPVSFYILLSGYGLSYVGRTTTSYKAKKVLKLYITFWIVLGIFPLLIGSFVSPDKYPGGFITFLGNATGYIWTYNVHNWFLLPYVLIYMSSGLIQTLIDKYGDMRCIAISFLLSIGSAVAISYNIMGLSKIHIIHLILATVGMLFPFVVGVVMEKLQIRGILKCEKITPLLAVILIMVLSLLRSLVHTHALNAIFAVMIIYLLIHVKFKGLVREVLGVLGKYSMPMWFIHGYFTLYLFHDYLVLLKYPLLIYLALVVISLTLSIPIMNLSNFFCKMIKL